MIQSTIKLFNRGFNDSILGFDDSILGFNYSILGFNDSITIWARRRAPQARSRLEWR
jgi:hypothetical protein